VVTRSCRPLPSTCCRRPMSLDSPSPLLHTSTAPFLCLARAVFELAASLFEPSEARNQLRSRVGLVSPCTSLWAAGHALLPHPPRWTVSRFARRHTAGLDRRLHSRRRESGMRRPDSLPSGQSHPVAALLCHLRTPRYLGARHAARLLAPSRLGCFRVRTHASLRGGLATRGARLQHSILSVRG